MNHKKTFILVAFIAVLLTAFGFQASPEFKVLFEKAKFTMETKGDMNGAIKLFNEIIEKYPNEREYSAKSQLYIGLCYEKLGVKEAQKAYQKVIEKYPEQTEAVKLANEKLSLLLRAEAGGGKGNKEFSIRKVGDVYTDGAVSPDGRYLSYVDWDTGDLAIYEITTGKKRRLTNKGSWDESDEFAENSRWSPDGKQIIYDWSNKNGDIDLCIIGLDGSKPRTLYSNDEENVWARTCDWSPDGKQILAWFETKDEQIQIVLVSTADGSVRVLKTLENWPANMNFSPDGRYIVYDFQQKEDSPERDISLLSIDGSREISLVEHPANDYVLGWAPDGENILFASDRRGSEDVWVIQFSNGKVQGTPKLVKSNIGRVYPMGFTQKGSFYYFIHDLAYDIYFAELDPETGKMLHLQKKTSTRFEGSLYQPEYSPDGKYIAYISVPTNRSADLSVSIQSLETGKIQEFPSKFLRNMGSLRWSPDGHSILVGGWDLKGNKGIYRIDTQSGIFTLIVPPVNTGSFYFLTTHAWSRDGKSIFLGRLSSNLPSVTQIMLREIESGTEKELYRGSGFLLLSHSPDGKWMAFINRGTGGFISIMPAAGGEPRELYKFKEKDSIQGIRWTPNGKYILFEQKQAKEKKFRWWRIPMEGGEPQKLELECDTVFYTSFHPDGRHVVFSSSASTGENSGNWVMENFLPK